MEHIESIRIGSKALAYWPQRFVTDPDADDTLRLFEQVVTSGRALAFMAHFSHPRELAPPLVAEAVRRIRSAARDLYPGATDQDDQRRPGHLGRDVAGPGPARHGAVLHVRGADTGPQDYFAVPLARASGIYRKAYRHVSGLCRTVRGPSMSATPGKVCVDGIAEIAGQQVYVLHMIQARDPSLVGKPFFARYNPNATWISDLEPVRGPVPVRAGPGRAARPVVACGIRARELTSTAR